MKCGLKSKNLYAIGNGRILLLFTLNSQWNKNIR